MSAGTDDPGQLTIPGSGVVANRKQRKPRQKRSKRDLTFLEYLRLSAVNWSTLKSMRESPLHYKHAVEVGREETYSLIRLRATHTAVLEPERFLTEYPVFTGKTRRGAEWEEFSAKHEGKPILKVDERDEILRQRDAILANPVAAAYLSKADKEVSLLWKDKTTGLACKGRVDALGRERTVLIDLKAGPTGSRLFASLAARMGYHNQLAFYADGIEHEVVPIIIVYEPKPPHDVAVFRVRSEDIEMAREENIELLKRVVECRKTGQWPGRYVDEQLLELPKWAGGYEDETDISGLGLEIGGTNGKV